MFETDQKPVILIVDDESSNINMLQEILEGDFDIMGTKSPEKSIELAKKFLPDLILLDVMMPGMDGWEVCKILKSNHFTQHIGVFFVTAKTDPQDRIKAFELGAQDYLTKPVLAKEVEARVKGYLAIKQKEKHLKKQLEQARKMEALGTLAGGIFHDINNLLMPIFGYGHVLMKRFSGKNLEMIQRINQSAARLSDLSTQILFFSRQALSKKETLIITVQIKEIIKLLRVGLPNAIRIKLNLPDYHLGIKADLTQVHQVVLNLCVNAAHAMKKNGLLKISLDQIEFDAVEDGDMIVSCQPGKYVRLRVKDDGCGMEPDILSEIFDPFYTTKDPGEGTGLGLATVKDIVAEHHGGIKVKSEPGKGTCFDVFFPCASENIQKQNQEDCYVDGAGETILLIDDEKNVVESISMVLEESGFTVISTTDSKKAVDLFLTSDIDLIITDYDMPGIDGFELAARIREIDESIPILFCTGHPNLAKMHEMAKNYPFIYKPFNPVQICELSRQLLDETKK